MITIKKIWPYCEADTTPGFLIVTGMHTILKDDLDAVEKLGYTLKMIEYNTSEEYFIATFTINKKKGGGKS